MKYVREFSLGGRVTGEGPVDRAVFPGQTNDPPTAQIRVEGESMMRRISPSRRSTISGCS
ncbi:MAG: hypothetical protein AB7J34_07075 [Limisphaerales bacterium]